MGINDRFLGHDLWISQTGTRHLFLRRDPPPINHIPTTHGLTPAAIGALHFRSDEGGRWLDVTVCPLRIADIAVSSFGDQRHEHTAQGRGAAVRRGINAERRPAMAAASSLALAGTSD
jgi:hypothetical protein